METLHIQTQQETTHKIETMRADTQRIEKIVLDFFKKTPTEEDQRIINLCESMGF